MRSFHRNIAIASTLLLGALAGCGGAADETGEAADAPAGAAPTALPDIEGVQNFYSEYGDYVTVMAAIGAGEVTAEDLEHPWVAQQDHVDAEAGYDGTPPAYDIAPPAGGNHLSEWQTCTGSVYPDPIVDGNAVHSMEHGAVWVTYDPALVDGDGVAGLASKIQGRDYSLMSPYPEQGVAVSLQAWGVQYQTDDLGDPKIDEFLDGYILNERINPEAMATCSGGVATTIAESGA